VIFLFIFLAAMLGSIAGVGLLIWLPSHRIRIHITPKRK